MKHLFVILTLIIFSFLFFSCDPGTSASVENNGSSFIFPTYFVEFTGTVKDTNNQPIDNVGVQYEFSFDSVAFAKTTNPQPSTTIAFSIPATGKVLLIILRYGSRELISVLMDTIQQAGNHSVIFDAKKMGNGIYIYQLTVNKKITEKIMVITGIPANDLINAKPIATTQYNGSFKIPTSIFGAGVQILSTSEKSPEIISYRKISNKIQLFFIKSGKIIGMQSVVIDTTQNQNMNFILNN